MKKKYLIIVSLIIVCTSLKAEENYILKPANGPYGGYIWSFCSDSSTKDIFANDEHIYKLNKITNIWEKQFDNLDSIAYHFYYLVYADSVYLASYQEGGGDQIGGFGMYRSTDKGLSWKKANNFNLQLRKVIASNSYLFAACGSRGIYRSSDQGLTWVMCNNELDSLIKGGKYIDGIEKIIINDKNYLFTRDYENGIFRSTDNGDSWQNISSKIPVVSNPPYIHYSSMTVTYDNIIYISSTNGIYKSTDFGENWIRIIKGIEKYYSYEMGCLRGDSKGNLYAGSSGIGIISLMHNESIWRFINNGLTPKYLNDIYFDESSDKILAATNGGVYQSTNQGSSWFFFNDGINIPIDINSIALDKNGGIFAGTERNGIYYSSDKGVNWKTINNGISDYDIRKITIDSKGNIYAVSFNSNIFKSSDNGTSWIELNPGKSINYDYIYDLAINSKDYIIPIANKYYTKKIDSLILSKDGGITWENIYFPHHYILSGTFDKNDNLFIATDSAIYRSKDNGLTWDEVLKISYATCFYVSKNNSIFLGNEQNTIFRSIDGGNTWDTLNQGLSDNSRITCISSTDIDDRIICGDYYNGFYISNNNGNSWTFYKDNLPPSGGFPALKKFREITYDGNGNLYAATYDGVYKWDKISAVQFANSKLPNIEIHPNPATDFIDIEPSEGWQPSEGYDILIFNTLGEIMLSVEQTPSSVQKIDISNLSPGMYFIKIGNKVEKFVKK